MDPSFVNYLNISVKDAYLKREHISESLINDLVQASLRVNYGQNINVHQFVGKHYCRSAVSKLRAVVSTGAPQGYRISPSPKINLNPIKVMQWNIL